MFVMEYWKQFKPIDQFWHTLTGIVYTFIAFFAFVTNLMVIYYLTRVKKKVRQDGSYFLINLAVVDAFKALIGLPFVVISSYFGRWMFGDNGCKFYGFIEGLFGFVSLATLSLMSIERYLIVSNPLRIFNKKFKITCLIVVWSYAALWVLLQFGSEHGYVLEGFLTSCSFDYFSRDFYTRIFMTSMFIGGFLVPLFILIIYLWLTKKTLDSKKKFFGGDFRAFSTRGGKSGSFKKTTMSQQSESSAVNPDNNSGLSDQNSISFKEKDSNGALNANSSEAKEFSFKKRQYRVMKTIFFNVVFFCIAWTPYAIIVMLAQYGTNIEQYITPYSTSIPALLAKTSSIYNPILYTLNNQDCKNYFKRTFFH